MADLEELCGELQRIGERGADAATCRKFRQTVESYQENAALLDPHLDALLAPLVGHLRRIAEYLADRSATLANETYQLHSFFSTSRLIWTVATVRGPKVVVQFFPPQPSDVEVAARLLDWLSSPLSGNFMCDWDGTGGQLWEVQCVLLLWLSQLALLPFTIFGNSKAAPDSKQLERTGLEIQKVVEVCKQHLASPSACQGVAGFLLGRLLSRPDALTALDTFMRWAEDALVSPTSPQKTFLIPGVLRTLSYILGNAKSVDLAQSLPTLWSAVMLILQGGNRRHTLTRKLAVKVLQRITIALMIDTGAEAGKLSGQLEQAIEVLLQGMEDDDTVVRWAVAKALAHIADRLTKVAARNVAEQVLLTLEDAHLESALHGGCLTLAELARLRLLPRELFGQVSKVIERALELDYRHGAHSFGAPVRDAGAYLCWALARAYATDDIRAFLETLAPSMLSAMCFDREVNCRRAVAAALQECIGRHDCLPQGIDVAVAADYFALSSRTTAYLQVAPQVARLTGHGPILRNRLLDFKLRHWDSSVRSLASKALAALAAAGTGCAMSELDNLLPLWASSSLEVRHGAVLGVAELLAVCAATNQAVAEVKQRALTSALFQLLDPPGEAVEGGELMRTAICRFMECAASARIQLAGSEAGVCINYILKSLQHKDPVVQAQAGLAMAVVSEQYVDKFQADSLLDTVLQGLRDCRAYVRRASAVALGLLAPRAVRQRRAELLLQLTKAIKVPSRGQEAEGRAAAVTALALSSQGQLRALNDTAGQEEESYVRLVQTSVIDALLCACQDYSMDKRGDVGSWVREAALRGLAATVTGIVSCSSPVGGSTIEAIQAVVGAMLQQAVERIDRVRKEYDARKSWVANYPTSSPRANSNSEEWRKAALEGLDEILKSLPVDASITSRERLEAIASTTECSSSAEAIGRVAELLSERTYSRAILVGLVYSIGGLDSSWAAIAGASLQQRLLSEKKTSQLLSDFIDVWEEMQPSKRLRLGFLRTMEILLLEKQQSAEVLLQSPSILGKIAALIKAEVKGAQGVGVLTSAIDILGRLTVTSIQCIQHAALAALLELAICPLPTVRQHAAEVLYLQLLGTKESDAGVCVLLNTSWRLNLREATSATADLFRMFKLVLPS